MKKFDMDAYTNRRLRELKGEKVYVEEPIDRIKNYTNKRIAEMRDTDDKQFDLDRSPLACYTVSTMGDRDGET